MACQPSRLLASAPAEQSNRRRKQPATATSPGSEAAAARSCQQQLSFRSKANRCTGLAHGPGPGASCQQQLSSGANLDSGSTSTSPQPADGILPTTTLWPGCGFCRIKGSALC